MARTSSWVQGRGGRAVAVGVVVALAAFGIAYRVLGPASGSASPQPNLAPGAFTSVSGTYDADLVHTFGGQPLQAGFGMRDPSPASTTGYQVAATVDATGLLQVTAPDGDIVALNLVPAPQGFDVTGSATGFQTTAAALVAISPGVVTAQPLADMVLTREIEHLPQTAQLAQALHQAATQQGTSYLQHPSTALVTLIAQTVASLQATLSSDATQMARDPKSVLTPSPPPGATPTPQAARPTETWVRADSRRLAMLGNPLPLSCDGPGIHARGGLEGDDVCIGLTEHTVTSGRDQVTARAVNRAPRWAFLYPLPQPGVLPLGVIRPKAWSIPGLGDLLAALGDAVANSSDVNGAKQALAWVDGVVGVTYHPYLSNDDFITQLQLQIRRFSSNTVSEFHYQPDAAREAMTVTFGLPRNEDRGNPGYAAQTIAPAVMTLLDEVVKPVVLVVLDIKDALRSSSGSSPETDPNEAATAAAATAVCADGHWSYSSSRRGTCSQNGGVSWWTGKVGKAGPGGKAPADPGKDGTEVENPNTCMKAYIALGDRVQGPVAKLYDDLTNQGSSVGDIVSALGEILGASFGNADVDACLLSRALFDAAKSGALGSAAQQVVAELSAVGISSLSGALDLAKTGRSIGDLTSQALHDLPSAIVKQIAGDIVTKVSERLAMIIVPGGDLLAAVKLAQQAPDIVGLVISVADLISTTANFGAGTVYTLESSAAIDTALHDQPEQVGAETAVVSYTPEWYGDDPSVVDANHRQGFWVSGNQQLDSFNADGTPAYTIRATSGVPGTISLSKATPDGTEVWRASVPNGDNVSTVHLIVDAPSGNIFMYGDGFFTIGGMVGIDNRSGHVVVNVSAGYRNASLSGASGWLLDRGVVFVEGLGKGLLGGHTFWAASLTSGAQQPFGASTSTYAWGSGDANGDYVAFANGDLYRIAGLGMTKVSTLASSPATAKYGVDFPICGGSVTAVTDDGYIARDDLSGAERWRTRVDPAQGTGNGNRARFSSVLLAGCDVVAADDHGVVARYHESSGGPHAVWTSRYGYYSVAGNTQSTDAAYPIAGLVIAGTSAIVASTYDPHVVAFDVATGRALWT